MAAGVRYAVAERGLWTSSAVTLMNAYDALGMWGGKLSGRVSVSNQNSLHKMLGARCLCVFPVPQAARPMKHDAIVIAPRDPILTTLGNGAI
jgi:hypothetical protein